MKPLVVWLVIGACFAFAASEKENGNKGSVDVPVRVFYQGKAVDALKKSDFILFEDKKNQTIDSLQIKTKKINRPHISANSPRYFILIFHLTEYNVPLQKSLAHFINHIPGKSDRLLVAANGEKRFYYFSSITENEKASICSRIDGFLGEQSKKLRESMHTDLKKIEELMDNIRKRKARESDRRGRGGVHIHYYMKYVKFSLEQYIAALTEYKKKYLVPNPGQLHTLLTPFETIENEKWVIHFFQVPVIPELSRTNRNMLRNLITELADSDWKDETYYSELFTKMLGNIDDMFNGIPDFPVEEMTGLFYKVNATFNAIHIQNPGERSSKNKKYQRLSTDIWDGLAQTAQRTGGTCIGPGNIDTNNDVDLIPALNTIENTEDIYYILSYTPENPRNIGKINIEAADKRYEVFFNDNEPTNILSVQLKDVIFKNKELSIMVTDFLRKKSGTENTGKIIVRIFIKNREDNKVLFNQSKAMLPGNDEVRISLLFRWLKKGNYDIGVEVTDMLTGKNDRRILQAVIR
ncbi:MAG: hypothetical protein GTN53_10630 [Candidatus Aminicenantes bacterium]|nr:hypothetical protein [Candidatus Aminicenantes bacterium]NIQ66907.1 hypothetical protein [Candidatus Aminicenantes bacterium]NIT22950.1 hypothetical protein [Candidatus Aminicenantes bacterium]